MLFKKDKGKDCKIGGKEEDKRKGLRNGKIGEGWKDEDEENWRSESEKKKNFDIEGEENVEKWIIGFFGEGNWK